MKIEDAYPFLLRVAIPEVTDQNYIPSDEELAKYFPKHNQKTRRKEKRSSNLVWDAIWRAHRDVLTGFRFKDGKFYAGRKQAGGSNNYAVNEIALKLFRLIVSAKQPLASKYLIDELCEEFKEPEGLQDNNMSKPSATTFGAIQKLVNMTLKYLLILKSFGRLNEGWLGQIQIDETVCDCPVDSVILDRLAESHSELKGIKWTCITKEQYKAVQEAIDSEASSTIRIMYDFSNWQSDDNNINIEKTK